MCILKRRRGWAGHTHTLLGHELNENEDLNLSQLQQLFVCGKKPLFTLSNKLQPQKICALIMFI